MLSVDALTNAKNNKNRASSKYYKNFDGFADVEVKPKFVLNRDMSFFTIGSCFARNVENHLLSNKVSLQSQMPKVQGDFFKATGPDRTGYQNVYTPGSILEFSRLVKHEDPMHSIVELNGLYYDLLTHGLKGLPLKEVQSIRENMLSVYRNIKQTDVLIMTLGYVEAWYYKKCSSWVNQSPADPQLRKIAEDFELQILDADSVYSMLQEAIKNFKEVNPSIKFIITVSPVPLGSTFSEEHILVANQRSKAVQHTVAQRLFKEREDVDYFPSYEMVSLSDRKIAFEEDHIHVKQSLVAQVMKRFMSSYFI